MKYTQLVSTFSILHFHDEENNTTREVKVSVANGNAMFGLLISMAGKQQLEWEVDPEN